MRGVLARVAGLGTPWLYALSALGAGLYVVAGQRFAVDMTRCVNWPGAETGWLSAAFYMLALALMSLAWIGLIAEKREAEETGGWRGSVLVALVVHAIILLAPPFLSDDVLAYGAIGALPALHGEAMYAPLGALPETDPFRQLIAQYPAWLALPSTYAPGANGLYHLLVALAGDNVRLALRLMQASALVALFATAGLTALAVRAFALRTGTAKAAEQAGLAALRLVLFAPLALIEASGNAHNDVFLALAVAGSAWAVARSRPVLGLSALLLGFLVKLSAILPAAFAVARYVARLIGRRSPVRRILWLALAFLVALAVLVLVWPLLGETASTVVRLVAPPNGGAPFCTRSLECLPRWLLHFGFGWSDAAWAVGLLFRAGGIALLLVLAWQGRDKETGLAALAGFILFYYLFLHGYMQAWYLLMLLPLTPFLAPRLKAVALIYMVSSLAQYGFDFAWSCTKDLPWAILREIGGLFVVLAPPLTVLALGRRQRLDN